MGLWKRRLYWLVEAGKFMGLNGQFWSKRELQMECIMQEEEKLAILVSKDKIS